MFSHVKDPHGRMVVFFTKINTFQTISQQAILTVRARDLNSAKSASGYSLAVLADYSVLLFSPSTHTTI